ncbi:MAG: 50S ribosomal protein L16 [Candidatus Nealsonbacteria bacterium RBG_13_42_11]|uniref:Large ribosomal subunit protein uL16 n=1 Tax=Candidatus Nealsonbacteria bacterium RBG_13_42_11 TaxID=1801663 RepID=A0A1G2DZ01_9BACT|nr:MAG: 50S ribosomal protein L16 [Candidatus Nealsonbacteria bacterium RBG_13_42_11]
MLMPKKVKHQKWHRGKSKGRDYRGTKIAFGSYALMSLGTRWITGRQLEAARRAILRYFKKGGKLWIRIFPDKPITTKGVEVPMGSGKGGVDHYAYPIRPGRLIFEIDGLKEDVSLEALRKASAKIPVKTKIISRQK